MSSSTAIRLNPGFFRLFRHDRAERLVRDDDGDRLDAVPDHRVEGRERQIGVEMDVLGREVDAELLRFGLRSADFGDEPRVLAHLVDVTNLDGVGLRGGGARDHCE